MFFPSTPISYSVEITFACNNACPGCANILKANRDETLYDWKALLDRIAPPQNRRKYAELIRITGGEPTLHKEFRQIIEYVDTFGIPHAIFTNGRWTHPNELIEIFQKCHHFVGLLVSLHGSTASAHNTFLGSDGTAFEETCSNIQCASDAGIEVFTNTVLTKYNCDQIEEIISLSQELGAGCAVFNRYLGKPHSIEPTEDQLQRAIRLIEQLQSEGIPCHLGDCVPPCFEKNSSLGSNGGFEHCVISPKGFVRSENLTSYSFGNIFEQSIEEIWQSEKALWYRNQVPKNCLDCIELPRCRGGCRPITIEYGFEGDRLMKEPIREASLETIELNPKWKPIPYFTIREEPFGYILCLYNWSIPVRHDAKPIVDAIDGETTLAQLQQQFGDEALDFIGQLSREGYIGFE